MAATFSGDGSQSSMGGGYGGDAFGSFDFSKGDVANAASGTGGLLEMISNIRGGKLAKSLGLLQASLFSSNADILKLQADALGSQADVLSSQADAAELGVNFAYAKGRQAESDVEDAGRITEATQRHWYASSHLDPAYGSPLLHAALTASQVQHDVGIVRASAQIEAADAETRRVNIETQRVNVMGQQVSTLSKALGASTSAAVARVKAGEAETAGYVGAGTAFLKTAGKMAAAGG